MKKIRVVQVGMGRMGNGWLKTVMASQEVEFAGFVEIDDQIIEKRVKEYGLDKEMIFKSLPEALGKLEVDGLINVTPVKVHEEICLTSLEAGIPVLCEKPLSDNRESVERIVKKSNETKILLIVGQNYRYQAVMQTLKKVLVEGKLGRPEMVYDDMFEDTASTEVDKEHIIRYWNKLSYPALIDFSTHHYDLIRFLFESEPVTIYGKSWNPSWSLVDRDVCLSVIMELKNGIKVSYNASCCSTIKNTGWEGNWRIECEGGTISVQNGEVWLFPTGKEAMRVEEVDLGYSSSLAYLLHEFYEALTKGIIPATICQDNIKTMNMIFDTKRSFETGASVKCKI